MNKKLGSTLIAMTIIIFMLFLTLGMFTKNFGGSASAEVASAQTKIADGQLLNDNIEQEGTGQYLFHIKNTDKDGNNKTQVKMKYKIFVDTNEDYVNNGGTVSYTLYRVTKEDGDTIEKEETPITGDAVNGFTDDEMVLGIDQPEVYGYILEFNADKVGTFDFKVKVESTQID